MAKGRNWRRSAAALGAGPDPDPAAEWHQLQALARLPPQELEIAKQSHCYLPADRGPMSQYQFIGAERGHHPVRQLCQVPGVPARSYYARQVGQQRAGTPLTPAWETVLVKAFRYHQRYYGTRRV